MHPAYGNGCLSFKSWPSPTLTEAQKGSVVYFKLQSWRFAKHEVYESTDGIWNLLGVFVIHKLQQLLMDFDALSSN